MSLISGLVEFIVVVPLAGGVAIAYAYRHQWEKAADYGMLSLAFAALIVYKLLVGYCTRKARQDAIDRGAIHSLVISVGWRISTTPAD